MPTHENFKLERVKLNELNDNEILLKALYISVDPYMRGRMNESKSYVAAYKVGEPIKGGVIAEVIDSRGNKIRKGDIVTSGSLPWATYFVSDESDLRKIDIHRFPPEYYLGVLGMPGFTAYFGMLDICKPQAGETVVVSGAAGAVGIVAGQIAKLRGAKVIGIAGSDEKCRMLEEEFGFDATINYKASKSIRKDLGKICPEGVDAYFDNVGGDITEGVAANLDFHARIALCGQISQYNNTKLPAGNMIMAWLLTKSACLQGFIVRNYTSRFDEAFSYLSNLVSEGKLKYTQTIASGFDKLPDSFLGLFSGINKGKMLVKIE